jgi:hypothetical protein
MSEPNDNRSKRTSSAAESKEFKPGPFVAIVRNHLDSTYMGGLEVELLTASQSGNSTNSPGQLVPVKYLSPFYGITSYDGMNKNEGHTNSQRSYGWWGVPPDIGSKVLVIFAEAGDGYWIGCIPEEHTNIMTPDPMVSTTYNSKDSSKKLPVVEYNKKTETAAGRNSTKFIKPANEDAIAVLTQQGLLEDDTRGVTSSSSRREAPSMVTGFSSPGPQDKRPGAPRVNYGENFAQTPVPQNRLGGSSLVFDDGDPTLLRKTPASSGPPVYVNVEAGETGGQPTLFHNELVRLRTRTGHQILLHNTEDLIYIANAKGSTWIELTSNGKIDIYAQDSINVHSETDINFKADKNIRFEAGENIHMKAGTSIFETAASNIELKAGADGKITAGGSTNIKSSHHKETAGTIDMNGPAAATAGDAEPSARVPEHEPWAGHENLFNSPQSATDTFRQSNQRESGSQASTQPAEAEEEADTGPTATSSETPETGVQQTPGASTGVTTDMQAGLNAVNANMSAVNVSNLAASIGEAAKNITYATTQTLTRAIDAIAGPGTLKNIISVTGEAVTDLVDGATDLLNLRTTLAKGQTPPYVAPSGPLQTSGTRTTPEDRRTINRVASGEVTSGGEVTMSDGTTWTATSTATYDAFGNRTDTWTVG